MMKKSVVLLSIGCLLGWLLPLQAQTPADSVALVQAAWQEQQLDKGLTARSASFSTLYGGPQRVFILEIDTRMHPLSVLTHNGRKLTSALATANGAVAAINGTYFAAGDEARSVCYLAQDGKVIDYTNGDLGLLSNGAVVIEGKDVRIIPWEVSREKEFPIDGKSVMSAGPLMVQNGRELDLGDNPGGHIPLPNPRSGIAQTDQHTVLLIVVDGRRLGRAHGVTIPQFAHLTRILGADSALNLDGGGSSVLWTNQLGILNTPSDGKERTVSNSILVR